MLDGTYHGFLDLSGELKGQNALFAGPATVQIRAGRLHLPGGGVFDGLITLTSTVRPEGAHSGEPPRTFFIPFYTASKEKMIAVADAEPGNPSTPHRIFDLFNDSAFGEMEIVRRKEIKLLIAPQLRLYSFAGVALSYSKLYRRGSFKIRLDEGTLELEYEAHSTNGDRPAKLKFEGDRFVAPATGNDDPPKPSKP